MKVYADYLFVDLKMVKDRIEYLEGLFVHSRWFCDRRNTIRNYEKELSTIGHNDINSYKRLCKRFDSFVRYHKDGILFCNRDERVLKI